MPIVEFTSVTRMHDLIPLAIVVSGIAPVTLTNVIIRYFPLPDLDAALRAALEPDPAPIPRWDPEEVEKPDTFSTEKDGPGSTWKHSVRGVPRPTSYTKLQSPPLANKHPLSSQGNQAPHVTTRTIQNEERPPPSILT